jgi:hypothetical protein
MKSEELYLMENDSLMFLAILIHNMGHKVSDLRDCAHLLKRDEFARSRNLSKDIDRISQVAEDLASDLNRMRLFCSDTTIANCHFLNDVLHPALDLNYRRTKRFRIIVDRSVREAPAVQLCPSFARQALLRLIIEIDPEQIRCSAKIDKDRVFFSLSLKPTTHKVDAGLQERLNYLLNKAGIIVEDYLQDDKAYSIRLQLKAV